MSVMRRLVGYLRDRSIGFKLGLIMLVPTLATVVVGFGALAANIGTAHNADRARILAGLTGDTGRLVHDLQNERAAVTMLLASNDSDEKKNAAAEFGSLVKASDEAAHDYTAHRAALTGVPPNLSAVFATIDDGLNSVGALRQQIAKGDTAQVPPSSAIDRYTNLITSLLEIRDSAAQLAGDSALSYEMRAAAAISQYKEYVSQERIKVLRIIDARELTSQSLDEFIGTLKGQEQALAAFKVVATPAQLNLQEQRIAGPDVREAGIYATELRRIPDKLTLSFSADQWDKAMTGWSNQVRDVEKAIDDQTALDAKKLRDNAQAQVYLDSGLLAALVLFAVLIAWLVARSMARSLRELRHGALGVAQFGLPQAVARLRDPTLSTQLAPHEVAQQIAEPLPVRSRDEFGQVTEAFNAVHLEAVRTAAEQAALRSSVSTMFVNLARRSQILVDRLIGHLDRLERGEEDPDRLAELFQLDHLATRMRRNDENLLVLAGAEAGYPPTRHLDAFEYLQRENFHFTIHAGEAFGLRSIWQALQWCGADRLGHGVRIVDDITGSVLGRLAAYVRDKRIPLELCPSSNVQTGAAASISDHPIGLLRDLRFRVTVNTDNRLMSGTSMARELALLVDAFGYGWSELQWFTVNAMKSAFIPFDERLVLINEVIKPAYAKLLG
jgi:methyl-accepting chemotaxis protein